MKLIESKTLGTAAASIEFTSIPQDGTDLLFLLSVRSSDTSITAGGGYDPFLFRFNNSDTGYSGKQLGGGGASAYSSSEATRAASVGGTWARPTGNGINNGNNTASTFSNLAFYVPNYTAAINKSVSLQLVTENSSTNAFIEITGHLWSNTAAITSVGFALGLGNYVAGSTISLYKITKGTDGIVTTSP